jgi:alternate F1F0 ATPase F0 subunit C
VVPGYEPPTASLSTTAALALCVLVAVPLFGISGQGLGAYLKSYVQPTPVMLPFNLISEVSRTLALAVRLFGNMMSGAMIIAILLSITPFVFPIVMTVLGLLTGMVQAYIFTILAAVYIAAATRKASSGKPKAKARPRRPRRPEPLRHSDPRFSRKHPMDSLTWIAVASIVMAGLTTGFGTMAPALAEGRAVALALTSLAQQPDASATITRTLFVGLAMIESTAIYCFVVSMILIFANPFWNAAVAAATQAAGK